MQLTNTDTDLLEPGKGDFSMSVECLSYLQYLMRDGESFCSWFCVNEIESHFCLLSGRLAWTACCRCLVFTFKYSLTFLVGIVFGPQDFWLWYWWSHWSWVQGWQASSGETPNLDYCTVLELSALACLQNFCVACAYTCAGVIAIWAARDQ